MYFKRCVRILIRPVTPYQVLGANHVPLKLNSWPKFEQLPKIINIARRSFLVFKFFHIYYVCLIENVICVYGKAKNPRPKASLKNKIPATLITP